MSYRVVTNPYSKAIVRAAYHSFPNESWPYWHRYNGLNANKYGSMDRCRIPTPCRYLLEWMCSYDVTKVGDCDPRVFPDMDFHAAGLHMTPPGGHLNWHLDAEKHPLRPWRRRYSAILFLNENWEPKWGGELLLGRENTVTVYPEMGKMVVFETHPESWHKVAPTKLDAPPRKTLSVFWWQYIRDCDGSENSTFL